MLMLQILLLSYGEDSVAEPEEITVVEPTEPEPTIDLPPPICTTTQDTLNIDTYWEGKLNLTYWFVKRKINCIEYS